MHFLVDIANGALQYETIQKPLCNLNSQAIKLKSPCGE